MLGGKLVNDDEPDIVKDTIAGDKDSTPPGSCQPACIGIVKFDESLEVVWFVDLVHEVNSGSGSAKSDEPENIDNEEQAALAVHASLDKRGAGSIINISCLLDAVIKVKIDVLGLHDGVLVHLGLLLELGCFLLRFHHRVKIVLEIVNVRLQAPKAALWQGDS